MLRISRMVATFSASALALALSASAFADDNKLNMTGSSTVAPLALELGKRFEKLNPGTRIDVQSGGTSRGISDARSGLADIGLASRALNPDEKDLMAYTIALDGITIVLNKANPVTTLSREQVVAIYTGKITNWKDVGGKSQPITVVSKAEGRSTLELFTKFYKLQNSDIKAQVIIGDNEQGIKVVAGNPNAIDYVSIGTAEYDANEGIPIKLLAVDGVPASLDNVRKRTFPLMRELNLVTKTTPAGLSKRFIDFAQSKAVWDIVKDQYFVPIAH